MTAHWLPAEKSAGDSRSSPARIQADKIGRDPGTHSHEPEGFSIKMSPRSRVSPGLTVKSLRICMPLP